MKTKVYLAGLALLILSLLLIATGSALAAPPEDNPGKKTSNFEKVVFVHYPQGAPARGGVPGAPGNKDKTGDKEWYKYSGIHWDIASLPVEYKVNADFDETGTFLAGIQNAFQVWEDDPGSYINFEYDATPFSGLPSSLIGEGSMNTANEISWAPLSAEYPNAIAITIVWYNSFTGLISEVDMAMNIDLPWTQASLSAGTDPDTVSGDPGYFDVQNIATHEAGHWLMLNDIYNKPAGDQTMYGIGAKGELKKRSLESGDLAGLQAIYGNP